MTQPSALRRTASAQLRAVVGWLRPLDVVIAWVAGRFGSRAREVERFLRFVVVGVVGAAVDFTTVIVLQATVLRPTTPYKGMKVVLATTIAFLLAVLSNFVWNRFWTYPDSRTRSIRRQLTQFTFINTVGWLVRTLWIRATFLPLGLALSPLFERLVQLRVPEYLASLEASAKLGTYVAMFIGLWAVMLWNFFANRYWTYNDVSSA